MAVSVGEKAGRSLGGREMSLPAQDNARLQALGAAAFAERDWCTAIDRFKHLKECSTSASDSVTALLYLGRAYRALNRHKESRLALREAFDLSPRKSAVLRLNAERAFADGSYDYAAKLWAELLKKRGQSAYPKVYVGLAASLRKAGKIDEALAIAQNGLCQHHNDPLISAEIKLLEIIRAESLPSKETQGKNPTKLRNPYQQQPRRSFWLKTAATDGLSVSDWYQKKFSLTGLSVATAGSCFAQHIGRRLRTGGFDFVDAEPAPSFLNPDSHIDFGYGMYSARYGNVYTSRQLLQLLQRALNEFVPEEVFWPHKGGVVDPFRPTIEPEPFHDVEELTASRRHHFESVIELFRRADVFVFTFGLTEAWLSKRDGSAFPIAPGVSGGVYDLSRYSFTNLSYEDVLADMRAFVSLARSIKPNLKFLLTVSPVPLMATATDENVIVATSYSKSVLRAVAGQLSSEDSGIDYFPSYEIISSHVMKGQFYEEDNRSVAAAGVDHVMRQFFSQHRPWQAPPKLIKNATDLDEVLCDEELLRTFGKQ